jgi:hypothetical protein
MYSGGIYAGEGEGIYAGAGGPYRTCKKPKYVKSSHQVKRCAKYEIHRKPQRRIQQSNLPMDEDVIPQLTRALKKMTKGGNVNNKRAAQHNPWLQFLKQWRARTGSNDLHLASQEYHRMYAR